MVNAPQDNIGKALLRVLLRAGISATPMHPHLSAAGPVCWPCLRCNTPLSTHVAQPEAVQLVLWLRQSMSHGADEFRTPGLCPNPLTRLYATAMKRPPSPNRHA